MPLPDDRSAKRGQALAYPEAALLVNPVEPEFKGEVRIASFLLILIKILSNISLNSFIFA